LVESFENRHRWGMETSTMTTGSPIETVPAGAPPSYRIDCFTIPAAARPEFEATMRRTIEFLATLPGYLHYQVFEKSGGPGAFDIITVATWASRDAHERAAARVRAYYAQIGFDPAALMARLGITGQLGDFVAPVALQIGGAS